MLPAVVLGLLLSGACSNALPTRMERMTISKMRMADLETSATGYVYNQQQGLPVSYVQYTNHGSGRYYHAPDTVRYVAGVPAPVAPAVPETPPRYETPVLSYATVKHEIVPYAEQQSYVKGEIGNYPTEQLPKYTRALASIKTEPRAPYYTAESEAYAGAEKENLHGDETFDDAEDDEEENHEDNEGHGDNDDDDDDDDEDEEHDGSEGGEEESIHGDFDISGKNVGFDGIHGLNRGVSSYEGGNGKDYSAQKHSAHGKKGHEGYKKHEEFSKGEHGGHDNAKHQGYYDVKGGHKKEDIDSAGNYGQAEEGSKSKEASSYGESSYHKKGHKTNGFHNVYRKDEYKKDTDFYDTDHKEGHFDKHGSKNEYNNAAEGGFKKGGHQYTGFDQKNNGKKGYFSKGHHDSHDKGHQAEEGDKTYRENYADYAAKGGSNAAKAHEYSKDYGHH